MTVSHFFDDKIANSVQDIVDIFAEYFESVFFEANHENAVIHDLQNNANIAENLNFGQKKVFDGIMILNINKE